MKFYKETNFKETPIGTIPKDWDAKEVHDLFRVETGTTPSTKSFDYWDGGSINWFTPLDLSKLNGRILIEESERKITHKALKECNLTLMPKDSIILSTRAPVGYVAVLNQEGTFNQGCKGLIPKDRKKAHSLFYAYYLLFKNQRLQNLSGGSTFEELSKSMLEKFKVPFPSFFEQEKISEVLSCVDLAIQKIDEAIAKAERLKKGLMQQLLTKGIGHKEFKETPIGKIPKYWKVVELKEVAQRFISGGTPSTKVTRYWNGDIPWIRSVHLTKYYIDNSMIDQYITREGLKNSASNIVPKQSLIVATRVGVGKSAVNLIDVAINQDLTGIIIDKSKVDPFYLVWYLHFPRVVNILESFSRGTTIKGIPQDHIKKLRVPLPSLSEQKQIAEILSSTDDILRLKKEKKEKLVRMKKRLMGLLLTGKVRVSV